MFNEERLIPKETRVAMLVVAVIIDITEVVLELLVVGVALDEVLPLGVDTVFWMWFKFYGVSFSKPNTFIFYLINLIIGEIPVFGGFYPEQTIAIWKILRENKKKFKQQEEATVQAIADAAAVANQDTIKQEAIFRIQERQIADEEEYSNVVQMPRKKQLPDNMPEFETPDTSTKKVYPINQRSAKNVPNKLDLRDKKAA